jgi:Rrf2 family iron-sulfur cluster assembly transcriptional regulator
MRITARGSYAVRALVDLASQTGTRPVSLREIAARGHISVSYLEQLFLKLRRRELVRSVRGPGGGYLLARTADSISVAEVIEAVEEKIEPIYCVRPSSDRICSLESCCAAHLVWKGLAERMRSYLSSVNLEEMVRNSEALRMKASPSTDGEGADPASLSLLVTETEGKP